MTSKISFFSIAKEDLRHRLWMLALSCLGSFLALPVTFLLAMRTYLEYVSRSQAMSAETIHQILQEEYIRFFTTESVVTEGIILCAGAFIVAIFGFRYLYSRKTVDLFHSLPVKRSRLFLVTYLNGLFIWLIPMLISMLAALVIAFVTLGAPGYFIDIAIAAGKVTLVFIFCFLIVYHLCLMAVMISGNAFNAICSALLLGTAAAAVYGLVNALCQVFLDTFVLLPISPDKVLWLSPLVSVVCILIETGDGGFLNNFLLYAVLSGLLSAGLFAASWALYLKRPSELAERGIQNKWFQTLLRLLGSLIIGLAGGSIFLFILGDKNVLGWCIFGIILCTVCSFGVLNIIFNMNFKAFFFHKAQMAGVTAAACLTLLTIGLDWTGYDSRVPGRDQIVGGTVYLGGYTDYTYEIEIKEDGSLINNSLQPYECDMNYTNTDVLYSALSSLAAGSSARDDHWVTYAYTKINLKNGSSFYRRYAVTRDQAELLRPIVESDEYRNTFYKLANGNFPMPSSVTVDSSLKRVTNYVEEEDSVTALIEAYYKDFRAHYRLEEIRTGAEACQLSMHYEAETYNRFYDLTVYDTYTNTLEVIRELFPDMVLTAQDLDISSIKIRPEVDTGYPKEILYSYFGLEGYPDYDEYFKIYRQGGVDDDDIASADFGPEAAAQVKAEEVGSSSAEGLFYGLNVSAPGDIESLLPYLHISDRVSSYFFGTGYVTLGSVYLSDGSSISCYVKQGELPEEWVEKIEVMSE